MFYDLLVHAICFHPRADKRMSTLHWSG